MKKNGFTLIELLGVIVIIAVITILIVPPLLNSINGNKDTISEANKRIVYSATDLYISDNLSSFPKYEGSTYCINIDTLIFKNLLDEKIYNENTGIKDDDVVRVYVNNNKYEKTIVKNVDCTKKLITAIVKGEDKNIAEYFEYQNTYNSVECSSDIDGGVSNSNELSVGLHRLTCSFDGFNMSIDAKVYENEYVFNYTGNVQEFDVPISGTYKVELWGASGQIEDSVAGPGNGAYTSGNIKFNGNELLYVVVGSSSPYNGGGYGEARGGGATDIRTLNDVSNDFDNLKSRIMVAAGGGGGFHSPNTSNHKPGHAGGLIGYDADADYDNTGQSPLSAKGYSGHGATQTSGGLGGTADLHPGIYSNFDEVMLTKDGKFGKGGFAAASSGGGSGYYGGGHGLHPGSTWSGGGGGSSFISGYSGCDAIAESSTENNIIHTGQPNHYSGKVFTDSVMIDGKGCNWSTGSATNCGTNQPQPDGTNAIGHSGNGYAKITLLSID